MQSTQVIIIEPRRGWSFPRLGEVWEYRDLLILFVRRDLVARYQQTILGPIWYMAQPILTALLFAVIFNRVAGIQTNGVPPILFYLAGLAGWAYFSQTLTTTVTAFSAHSHMFEKVYFPRLLVPLATILSSLGAWAMQVVTYFIVLMIYWASGTWHQQHFPWETLICLPLLAVYTAVLSLGINLWIISLTMKYRDFTQVFYFIAQLWLYATPVIYPLSQVPTKWRDLFLLNPMAPVIEMYRHILLGAGEIWCEGWAVSILITLGILISGCFMFDRTQKTFVDTI